MQQVHGGKEHTLIWGSLTDVEPEKATSWILTRHEWFIQDTIFRHGTALLKIILNRYWCFL